MKNRREDCKGIYKSAMVFKMNLSQEYNTAVAIERGKGVPKDEPEAARRYEALAAAGHLRAMDRLGKMYQDGRGVEQSDEVAAEWFRKSAEGGDAAGQLDYGWIFAQGRGVEKNDELAFTWYMKSAMQGNSAAQCNVGLRYESGKGVIKDDRLAREWFQRSAGGGSVKGLYRLGLIEERRGQMWLAQRIFYRAYRRGHELSGKKVRDFLLKLRPENACDVFIRGNCKT